MSTYVYGITRTPAPPLPDGLTGVGDPPRPVRVLERDGLVTSGRDPADGRATRLRLTPAGESEMRDLDRKSDALAA